MLNKTVVAMASLGHPGNMARAITLDNIKKFEFPYEIDEVKLPDCTISNITYDGISIWEEGTTKTISNCTITNC